MGQKLLDLSDSLVLSFVRILVVKNIPLDDICLKLSEILSTDDNLTDEAIRDAGNWEEAFRIIQETGDHFLQYFRRQNGLFVGLCDHINF